MARTSASNLDPHKPRPAPLPVTDPSKSFWHSEPSAFLLGHRTTADLPRQADVVIIGSGITGASAARYLAEGVAGSDGKSEGKRNVVVLDAREACWGATGRNGGHLQPLLFDRTPEIAAFELKNCAAIADYIRQHNIACEYRAVTGCRTFWTERLLAEAIDAIHRLQKADPEVGSLVDVITDRAGFGKHRVAKACLGITLSQGAASLWPYKYVTHVLEKLVKAGQLNLQTKTPVTAIHPLTNNDLSPGSPSTRGPRWRVSTPRGPILAHHVLLATNGHTSHLLPQYADIFVPCRATMTALIPPRNSTLLPDSYGMVGLGPKALASSDDYLIQRPFKDVPNRKGHLMFGGGREAGEWESIGESDDSVVDEGCVTYLKTKLLEALDLDGETKGVRQLAADYAWSGIMCYSRDNNPWVGHVPDAARGLWVCGGYTGHGMPNAGLCARAVVGMIGAEEKGRLGEFEKELVANGGLPIGYLASEERVRACRRLASVKEQNDSGVVGYPGGEFRMEKL